MKVLLVNPEIDNFFKSVSTPLGLLSIATHIHNKGHQVKLIDMVIRRYDVEKILDEFNPDVVGISVTSTKCISDALRLSRVIKHRKIPVVWGGHMASSVPEISLRSELVDYITIGEGEFTWEELLSCLESKGDVHSVAGLAFLENGVFVRNADRELSDLADLPVMDWSLIHVEDYFQTLFGCKKMLSVYTLKGCPGRCAFCFCQSFQKCSFRRRPIEYVMQEVRHLVEAVGADGIHYGSEMIARNSKELHEFCDRIDSMGLKFVWGGNARVGMIDPDDFKYMYDKGCRWLYFGLESGSAGVQTLMNKNLPLDKVKPTIQACTDAGIAAITSYIVGYPDETPEDLQKTIDLKKSIPTAMGDCNLFYLFPETDICNRLISEGRYKLPERIEDFSGNVPFERLQKNYSAVPDRDLRVARAFILWSTFTRRTSEKTGNSNFFAAKAVTDAVKRIYGFGFKKSLCYLCQTGGSFLEVVNNLLFFPGIRKKYGMYDTKSK